jgi:DNA-binding CsgD family transcriptional regulator
MDWITEESLETLAESVELANDFSEKMTAFRSGLIAKDLRWYQLAAHRAYDQLSSREKEVFMMRLRNHSFPLIAEQIGVSVSSAKTYWRRCIKKCGVLFNSVAYADNK